MWRSGNVWLGWVCLALLGTACGGDVMPPPGSGSVYDPFVGTWDAVTYLVTSDADSSVFADFLMNGSFALNVQPSGTYTATLVLGTLTPFVEIGHMSVASGTVRFVPNGPDNCPASAAYAFADADAFSLDGPTCFDFNLDGTDEAARAEIDLVRH